MVYSKELGTRRGLETKLQFPVGQVPQLFISSKLAVYCTARQYWPICQNFGECVIINLTFIGFEETSSYWSVLFSSVFFHMSPSIGKPRMTPVAFVKTTNSYEVSLVTVNRQTSYTMESYKICRWIA